MGELHLEIIVDRLLREFKVEANVGAPQVAYKETIRKAVDQDTKYARQSGGKGQYGHVKIDVEPNESGKGYEFVNAVVGGAIPKEYIPPSSRYPGRHAVRRAGRLPLVDVKVTCSTVPITRWTPPKWRSRSPVPWPSRRLCAEGGSRAAGAHHEGVRHRARRVHGRRDRRPECPARSDPGL